MRTGTQTQTTRRDAVPLPRQVCCPRCGCRRADLTSTGYGPVQLLHWYTCAGCGTEYRCQYSLVSKLTMDEVHARDDERRQS
jgi:transcription elongation factor Elf1